MMLQIAELLPRYIPVIILYPVSTVVSDYNNNITSIVLKSSWARGKTFTSFQMMGAATEKARLPRFRLVLGMESCCEVDDLSCLGMLEKSRRLATYDSP